MKKLFWIFFFMLSTAAAAEKYQFIPLPTEGVRTVTGEYQPQILNCRVDEDALSDLAVIYGDHVYFYFQNEDGTYGEEPEIVRRPEPGAKTPGHEPLFRRVTPNYTVENTDVSAFFVEDLDGDGLPEVVSLIVDTGKKNCFVNVFWNKGDWNDAETPKKDPGDGEEADDEEDEKGFAREDDVFGAPDGAFLLAFKDINNDGKIDLVFLTPQGVEACLGEFRNFGERKLLFKADSIAGWINRETNQLQRCDFVEDVNRDGRMEFLLPVIGGMAVWGSNERGEYSRQAEISYDLNQLPARFTERFPVSDDNILVQPGETDSCDLACMFMLPTVSFEDIDKDGAGEIILNIGFRSETAWKFDAREKKYREIPGFRRPWGLKIDNHLVEETNEREYRLIFDRNEAFDPLREPDILRAQTPFTPEGLRTNLRIFFNCKGLPCLPGSVIPDYDQADASIREASFLQQQIFGDVNGDNRLDLAFFATKYQLTDLKSWMAASKGNIKGDLIFYLYDPNLKGGKDAEGHRIPRGFGYKPNGDFALRDIKMNFNIEVDFFEQRVFNVIDSAISLAGDFNRDGKKDLMVRTGNNTLQLYFNTGKIETLFPNSPNLTLKAPDYADVQVEDFNGDGVSDFFFSEVRSEDIENPPGSTAVRHVLAVSISAKKE